MTQQEILNLPNLKIAELRTGMFLHIHAADGYMITSWHEGDDIKDYSGSFCMWMPIRDNYDGDYRVITKQEHDDLEAKSIIAIEVDKAIENNTEPVNE